MNSSMNNKIYWTLGTIIVILAIIWISLSVANRSSAPSEMSTSTDMTTATYTAPEATSSDPMTSVVIPKLAFSIGLGTSTYSQNSVIPIVLSVLNISDATQTLSFTDGCQATYNIGTFSMLAHTTCRPDPTSFDLGPNTIAKVPLTHYPSVYKIPPGKYNLSANLIGYGGTTIPVTITQ